MEGRIADVLSPHAFTLDVGDFLPEGDVVVVTPASLVAILRRSDLDAAPTEFVRVTGTMRSLDEVRTNTQVDMVPAVEQRVRTRRVLLADRITLTAPPASQ
jgi:hypothetical protein